MSDIARGQGQKKIETQLAEIALAKAEGDCYICHHNPAVSPICSACGSACVKCRLANETLTGTHSSTTAFTSSPTEVSIV